MPRIEVIGAGPSAIPEGFEGLPRHNIPIETMLEEIADPPECPACGMPMRKAAVSYYCGTTHLAQVQKAPGYQCARDNLEILSEEVMAEFYPKAAEVLRKVGDAKGAQAAEASARMVEKSSKQIVKNYKQGFHLQ